MSIQLGWVFVGLCILWVTPWILAFWALAIAYDARAIMERRERLFFNTMEEHYRITEKSVERYMARCIKWPKWGGG
jgi:hypothetical protein